MRRKLLVHLVVPVAIVVVGLGAAGLIFWLGQPGAGAAIPAEPPVVETLRVSPGRAVPRVETTGLVVPSRELVLTPEVPGKIVERSESLVPGGRVGAGEVLVRLDRRDYELAVRAERAKVASAELQLASERGRQSVAEQEWAIIGERPSAELAPLALRERHVATAEANLDAARAGLDKARLDLERTLIRAPWNATVVAAGAEPGQVVQPGAKLASLVGTDSVWVRASVPLDRIEVLEVPLVNAERGSTALVRQQLGGERTAVREGRLLKLVTRLDDKTRNAELIIEVPAPLEGGGLRVPLLPGSFVSVSLEGRGVEDVYELPRAAVREGSRVWVLGADRKLEARRVTVLWGTDESVFARDGLEPGDRVLVSDLPNPVEGMRVRLGAGLGRRDG